MYMWNPKQVSGVKGEQYVFVLNALVNHFLTENKTNYSSITLILLKGLTTYFTNLYNTV